MRTRRRERLLYLAAALFLLGPWLRPATAQFLGSEFQVNTYTTVDQYGPAVTADGSGNFVIVWSSVLQDGSSAGVFGQRFNSVGAKVGSELQVNTYTTNIQRFPVVAADSSGNFVVAWQSNVQDGSLFGVFGQRFDLAGTPVGSEFRVNSYTTNTQLRPAVAADGLDNFVVAWQSLGQDLSSYGVFGQRFNSVGSPVGSEFQVNTNTEVNQQFPALAADGAGNFVVTWESLGQGVASYGVFGQRFNSAGSQVGSEFQVNTYTTNAQRDPAVAADSSGNFVVVWESDGQDGASAGVFGQRFDSAGGQVGSEFRVNTYTTNAQRDPAVAVDSSGRFVVAWTSFGQDGHDYGIFGQRFDSTGSRVGSALRVNTFTTFSQEEPTVAADSSGNFVVAWTSGGQDGSDSGVFGQRLRSWIFLDDFESGDVCAWSAAVGSGDICPP